MKDCKEVLRGKEEYKAQRKWEKKSIQEQKKSFNYLIFTLNLQKTVSPPELAEDVEGCETGGYWQRVKKNWRQ